MAGAFRGRLGVLAVALAVAALYVPLARWMVGEWRTHPYAGHGMFVPAISLVILASIAASSGTGEVILGHRSGCAVLATSCGVDGATCAAAVPFIAVADAQPRNPIRNARCIAPPRIRCALWIALPG